MSDIRARDSLAFFEAKQANVDKLYAVLQGKGIVLRPKEAYRFCWDEWELYAWYKQVPADLVQLGRSVMRECMQHAWPAEYWKEVGPPAANKMIELALANPEEARTRWGYLLETDGEIHFEWGNAPDSV